MWILLMGLFLGIALPQKGNAVGFRLPNQDPEAIARGDAFAATADNPSAIYYNPAGITQLQGDRYSRGNLRYFRRHQIYIAQVARRQKQTPLCNLFRRFTMCIHLPTRRFPSALEFMRHTGFRWTGETTHLSTRWRKAAVLHICASIPSLHGKVLARFPSASDRRSIIRRQNLNKPSALFPGGQFKFEGDDTGIGFNAGILWQPHPMWSFGVNYRSATTFNYKGTASRLRVRRSHHQRRPARRSTTRNSLSGVFRSGPPAIGIWNSIWTGLNGVT